MEALITAAGGKHKAFRLDPRTKVYMLLIVNIIMLTSLSDGFTVYLKPALSAMSFLFVWSIGKRRMAVYGILLYLAASREALLLSLFSGTSVIGVTLRLLAYAANHAIPGMLFAYYVLQSTKVSEFIAAMERLRITEKFIIPFAVIFRFFPTVADEYRSIRDAMRMRGISLKKGPVAMLEYRLVPLIVSIVKIGDELSAASVTRGLGSPTRRTNYCRIGFGLWDGVFFLLMTAALILYLAF